MEAAAILGPDKEGEDMKTEHSYSAKGVLAALGRSALYLLFFVAVQVLLPFVFVNLRQVGHNLWRQELFIFCFEVEISHSISSLDFQFYHISVNDTIIVYA